MKPAFSSRAHLAAYTLTVAILLALPALVATTGRLRRQDAYSSIPSRFGPFPWIRHEIFSETGDVDMAFLGSSHIWCAIDTPYVQRAFSARLNRQANVITLGWPWAGFDELYVIARDFLDRRHVHTLVIYDESSAENVPHPNSSRLFRLGETPGALLGLTMFARIELYGGEVLTMPRHLLSSFRPDLPEDPSTDNVWTSRYHAPPIAERLGSLRARLAFGHSPRFLRFAPTVRASPADTVIYGADTRASFKFGSAALAQYQHDFALKLARLCREHGTRLVVLHTPSFAERADAVVSERVSWPDLLGGDVSVIGIPPARMFAGMSTNQVMALFYENGHLNENGQDVFTPLITPALLNLYELQELR